MKEHNEEISIWEVLSFLKKVITHSKALFKKLIFIWVVIFALGYIYYSLGSKSYQSEMYVSTKNMNREELSSQIIYLNKLIFYSGYDELSSLLGIPQSDASNLQDFRIEPYVVEEPTEGEPEKRERGTQSKITVKSKSSMTFKILNNTLADYLNNTAYSEMLNGSQKDKLLKLKNTYTSELHKLDSLESKTSSFKMRRDDDLGIILDGPSEVAKARISLIEKIAQTEKDLRTDIGVKVIKEFYIPSKPYYLFKFSYVLISFVACVLISYLFIALFLIVNTKLSDFEKQLIQ